MERSEASMGRALEKYDLDKNRALSFDQFKRFLADHPDVIELSTRLMQDKLEKADLVLKPLEDACGRIKRERSQREASRAAAGGGEPARAV